MAAVKPQRFIDTGVSPGSSFGSRPSSAVKSPSSWRVTCRLSTRRPQPPVAVDVAGAPGHRVGGDDGVAQAVGDEGVVGRSAARCRARSSRAGDAVDVVGVDHGEGPVADDARGRTSTAWAVPRGTRLLGEGDGDRRGASTRRTW